MSVGLLSIVENPLRAVGRWHKAILENIRPGFIRLASLWMGHSAPCRRRYPPVTNPMGVAMSNIAVPCAAMAALMSGSHGPLRS